jgi:hypothetical protein
MHKTKLAKNRQSYSQKAHLIKTELNINYTVYSNYVKRNIVILYYVVMVTIKGTVP